MAVTGRANVPPTKTATGGAGAGSDGAGSDGGGDGGGLGDGRGGVGADAVAATSTLLAASAAVYASMRLIPGRSNSGKKATHTQAAGGGNHEAYATIRFSRQISISVRYYAACQYVANRNTVGSPGHFVSLTPLKCGSHSQRHAAVADAQKR